MVHIRCNGNTDREVECHVFSAAGLLLYEEHLKLSPGEDGFSWDLRDVKNSLIANGLYLVEVKVKDSTGENRHIEKLVVLR